MNLGLTDEQKLTTLRGTLGSLNSEIYTLLIRMGVDPDTFESVENLSDNPLMSGEKARLEVLLSSRQLVEEKISSLS